MHRSPLVTPTFTFATALAALALAACGGARAASDDVAPTTAAATPPATTTTVGTRRDYVPADVRFLHDMIAHHGQALAMTAMVATHGAREELRLAAERIDVSQRDEIALMQRWLRRRGEPAPEPGPDAAHAHHAAGAAGAAGGQAMPGMLTPAELARLDSARGPAFERLFLASMIRHHEGALAMVKAHLATPGAAQEPELFRFASDVDADQRAEIRRMRTLLDATKP